jgi:hypothetical protein
MIEAASESLRVSRPITSLMYFRYVSRNDTVVYLGKLMLVIGDLYLYQ